MPLEGINRDQVPRQDRNTIQPQPQSPAGSTVQNSANNPTPSQVNDTQRLQSNINTDRLLSQAHNEWTLIASGTQFNNPRSQMAMGADIPSVDSWWNDYQTRLLADDPSSPESKPALPPSGTTTAGNGGSGQIVRIAV